MKNFKFYKQLDKMDCGPTCLRMIAKHYGRYFSAQDLRERSNISKRGVSLLGIAEAAENVGFHATGVRISFEQLIDLVQLPCIIHWNKNHFVVIYKVERKLNWRRKFSKKSINTISSSKIYIHVADPSKGLVKYSAEEFCDSWLGNQDTINKVGTALLLEPTPSLTDSGSTKGNEFSFGIVLQYLFQSRAILTQVALSIAITNGIQLFIPLLTQSIVDVGINTHNIPFLYLVLAAQLMLMFGKMIIAFIQSRLLMYASTKISLSILSDYLMKLLRLPVPFFDTKNFGDLIQRIGDHKRVENFVTGQALILPFTFTNTIVLSIIVLFYSLPIFCIVILFNVLNIGWIYIFLNLRRDLDNKLFNLSAKSQNTLIQMIQSVREIKLTNSEKYNRGKWEKWQVSIFNLKLKSLSLGQIQQLGAFFLHDGKDVILTFIAARAVIQGHMTLGAMLAMQQLLGQLNGPFNQLMGFVQGLQDAKISLERLNEVHSIDNEDSNIKTTLDIIPKLDLLVSNMTYAYPGAGNEAVLKNLNLIIPTGKITAIVGKSGSGKTTILKLLLKFYSPTSGEIKLGNIPLNNISHSSWRAQCGVVMQDGFIFSDSIARNIAVGAEYIDSDMLMHAVNMANLHEFIYSLPNGLDTAIGVEGMGISQGQKQRILIARAIYKNPNFILFDEATNSLDSTNELIIMENLNDFFSNRTVVVVAHRLSTVCKADQIVVLDKGVITEVGDHNSLIEKKGSYWNLVKDQLQLTY